MFRRIVQANVIVGIHVILHGIHGGFGSFNPSRVSILHILVYSWGRQPTVSSARKPENHGEITFFNPLNIYFQVNFWC